MRRIYDSPALHRDDDEPHAPRERDRETQPQAMRSVPSGLLSKLFAPMWLRTRAIGVNVSTPEREYVAGRPVPFTVELYNRLPMPITLPVVSPVPWIWSVDDYREASHVPNDRIPDEPQGYHFERGEHKRFTKRWSGSFQIGPREWEQATPGEHTIGVAINVEDPEAAGLTAETTIQLTEE